MGLFDRVERGLERTVNRAFAKAFRSEVQPVEIAAAIRRAMDDKAAILGPGRTMVPNRFTIELSTTDFRRLDEYADALCDELVAAAQEHAESQRYTPGGALQVAFTEGADLETGVFRIRPTTTKRGSSSGRAASSPAAAAPAAAPRAAAAPAAAPPASAAPVYAAPVPPPRPSSAAPQPSAAARAAAAEPATKPDMVSPAARPWLEVAGERYPLLGSISVLGRDPSADIVLDDPGISRRHSEVRVTNDGSHLVASVRDLASTNGTFVNGQRITSSRLVDGDRLTVGRTSVTFHAGRR